MVSRLDHDERTLPIRRPPSVSSRSSATTRRHNRHHRSHVGGSSYQPQNEFPVFAHTGDIEIVIASERREQKYLLHRLILAQCSGFFDAGTSEEWSRGQHENSGSAAATVGLASIPEATAASAQRKRWRYEIDWGNKKEDVPTLIQAVCNVNWQYWWEHIIWASLLTLASYRTHLPRRYLEEIIIQDHPCLEANQQQCSQASSVPWQTSRPLT